MPVDLAEAACNQTVEIQFSKIQLIHARQVTKAVMAKSNNLVLFTMYVLTLLK
jgi:CRISPR/Cas system-associated protein endoribonuclease Cas2